MAKVYVASRFLKVDDGFNIWGNAATAAAKVEDIWPTFLSFAAERNTKFTRVVVDQKTGQQRKEIKPDKWLLTPSFIDDVDSYFGANSSTELGS